MLSLYPTSRTSSTHILNCRGHCCSAVPQCMEFLYLTYPFPHCFFKFRGVQYRPDDLIFSYKRRRQSFSYKIYGPIPIIESLYFSQPRQIELFLPMAYYCVSMGVHRYGFHSVNTLEIGFKYHEPLCCYTMLKRKLHIQIVWLVPRRE
jgi:hypothetical protein